jgi:hypothetical protein
MNDVPTRMLRDALQSRVPAAPSHECLDAETVAAWADHAFGRNERQAAEAHAADCTRCQALLAAMAATMPQPAARPWWRLPAMRWLVPLTVATAAVLVWVNVPRNTLEPSASSALREAAPEPPRAPADASSIAQPPLTFVTPAQTPAASAKTDKEMRATIDRIQKSNDGQSRNERLVAPANALAEAARNAAGSTAAAPLAPPAAASESTTPLASAAAGAPERSAAQTAPAPAPPVALQRSTVARPAAFEASARMFDAQSSPTVIVSPSPNSVWRIAANGAVEHSSDRGSTWALQSTGVTVRLTAGASPAPSICWLVGPQGIVLLTTDARVWRRIAFPEAVALMSVRAVDDKIATVSAVDGRSFSTTDGGQTWK